MKRVVLKAADLGTFTVDGVEYQVADTAEGTVEYSENVENWPLGRCYGQDRRASG